MVKVLKKSMRHRQCLSINLHFTPVSLLLLINNFIVFVSLNAKEFPLFKDAVIRVDRTTEVVRASVLDVFAMVLGASNTARMAWKSIRDKCVNISPVDNGAATADVDFVGQNIFKKVGYVTLPRMSKPTPVAPFSALLELIYLLPGKRAHQVRSTSAKYMSRLLAGDLTLIDEIEARFDNTTEEERDMFRAGTDESPDRKRHREEMQEERGFRIQRETAELAALEMNNIEHYRTLLTSVGLGNDPTMQQTVVDAVANICTQTRVSTVPAITARSIA